MPPDSQAPIGIRHTYVVYHGLNPPRVGIRTPILGGQIEVVAGGDLSARLDRAEADMEKARELLNLALGVAPSELEEEIRDFLETQGE